jgi:hypothetical protein
LFFLFLVVRWDWVYLVSWTQIGPLYQPRMMDDECEAIGGMKAVSGNGSFAENLWQCHFVHHTPHLTWHDLGSNPSRRDGKPATNGQSFPEGKWLRRQAESIPPIQAKSNSLQMVVKMYQS